MQIIHRIDNFLKTIFPELIGGGNELIFSTLQNYYSYGPYKPKITIEGDWVKIDIDASAIIAQGADFKKVVTLSEKGQFNQAKPILQELIAKNPTVSEYHRIMGQMLSDEGDQEEAINYLIDALRWDPKNGWALMMVGNIFFKHKNDLTTAMKYYDQALLVNPKDYITINNIGANLLQERKYEEAKKYFKKALSINADYPNTYYALSLIEDLEGKVLKAFNLAIQALKKTQNPNGLYRNAVKQVFECAQKLVVPDRKIYKEYLSSLEKKSGYGIEIVEDESIATPAKLEVAENYHRDTHIVRFKPKYPGVEHLIMHELVHLDLIIQAREHGNNLLFTSIGEQKAEFIADIQFTIKDLKKKGIPQQSIDDYSAGLFNGLNSQIYNAPIDLFIEDFLNENFPVLKPYQFLSLFTLLNEGIKAVTDKNIVELSPKNILSKSKIYNIVGALQFKELFGIDLLDQYKATPIELKQADKFYAEYLEYRSDREPAEEYELVQHWAEDLRLDKYFDLVDEKQFRAGGKGINDLLTSIEQDPFGLESDDAKKERDMKKFLEKEGKSGLNSAVAMYMLDALNYFKDKSEQEIKKTAIEIAMLGTQGYSPEKDNYTISSIPDKKFSGYHILAYYYVSWALAMSDALDELQLPYKDEYELAKKMFKTDQF